MTNADNDEDILNADPHHIKDIQTNMTKAGERIVFTEGSIK